MDGFGDFDFNVSGGQGDFFQGNQNIVIEESNTNPESNDNNIYKKNNNTISIINPDEKQRAFCENIQN